MQRDEAFLHVPKQGKRAIVFTDLDGTLLEHDGSILPHVVHLVRRLQSLEVLVVLVTSKTRREVTEWLERLEIPGPAIFENGAGVLFASRVKVSPAARPAQELEECLNRAARAAEIVVRMLTKIPEAELEYLTGLSPDDQRGARSREFSVPFLMEDAQAPLLEDQLRAFKDLCLVQGGRFWHLMGRHTKADFFPHVREECGAWGTSIGLGDAPNDIPILAAVDHPVLIPGSRGLSPELARLFPAAFSPNRKAGAGWVEAIDRLVPLPGR